jgi:hypothetical protein
MLGSTSGAQAVGLAADTPTARGDGGKQARFTGESTYKP